MCHTEKTGCNINDLTVLPSIGVATRYGNTLELSCVPPLGGAPIAPCDDGALSPTATPGVDSATDIPPVQVERRRIST